jgi:hypothetical protein
VDFWQSTTGMDYLQNKHSFGVSVAADGSFRAENVTPGDYTFSAFAANRNVQKKVTIPDAQPDGGEVDLGTIPLPAPR